MGNGQTLALEPDHVVGRPSLVRFEGAEQRGRAPGPDPAARHHEGIVRAHQTVVGGDDPARGRVDEMGQRLEGHERRPVSLVGGPGVGPRPVSGAADGEAARGVPRDVAVHVRVDEVLGGAGELAQRLLELLPVRGAVHEQEGRQLRRVVQRGPPQRIEPPADLHQRPVARHAHAMHDGARGRGERAVADLDRLLAHRGRVPPTRDAVTVVPGELLDVEVAIPVDANAHIGPLLIDQNKAAVRGLLGQYPCGNLVSAKLDVDAVIVRRSVIECVKLDNQARASAFLSYRLRGNVPPPAKTDAVGRITAGIGDQQLEVNFIDETSSLQQNIHALCAYQSSLEDNSWFAGSRT